jgi:O-antigen/teichoic acid export membrane protein
MLGAIEDPAGDSGQNVRATRVGARAGLVSGVLVQALSVLASVVLARLLDPAAFGVVALANLVLSFVGIFTAFGIGFRLIRARELDRSDVSTYYWGSILLGLAVTVIVIVIAPLLAVALGQPAAQPYIQVLALSFLIRSVSGVPRAVLQRQMRHSVVYLTDLASMVVYVTVQIALAAAGLGAWAVILGQIAQALAVSVALVAMARFVPSRTFRARWFLAELGRSLHVLSFTILTFVAGNLDYAFVSRRLGAAALGIYYIAFVVPVLLRQRVTWVASDVLVPLFSRLRDGPEVVRAFTRYQQLSIAVGAPAMLGLAAVAEPLILTAFGAQWRDAIDPMRWIALAAFVDFAGAAVSPLYLAFHKERWLTYAATVRVSVLTAGLVLVAWTDAGLPAVAAAVFVASLASQTLSLLLVHRIFDKSLPVRAGLRLCSAAVVMAVLVYAFVTRVELSPPVSLAIGVLGGGALFAALSQVMARQEWRQSVHDIRSLVRPGGIR